MSFALKTRRDRGVVLVDMSGRLSAGESVVLLRNTVNRLVEEDHRKFVLESQGRFLHRQLWAWRAGDHLYIADEQRVLHEPAESNSKDK
jgi:hypothetical protein